MEPAIVTVITPHYDCARYLRESIASILAQTFARLELYLVDDHSPSDDWLAVTREFTSDPRLHLYRTSRNVGPYRIANRIIRNTTTPFIAFHDADDRSHPRRLELLLEAALSQRADLIGSAARIIDSAGSLLRVKRFGRNANLRLTFGFGYAAHHGATMIRREAFEKVGVFDGTARFAADTEFLFRAHHGGLRLRNINDALYDYRLHEGTLSTSPTTGLGSRLREEYIGNRISGWRWRRGRGLAPVVDSDVDFDLTPLAIDD